LTDVLPTDHHVHSEWSWDAVHGSMEGTCARAVELGVPAVAFTEHLDHTAWTVGPGDPEAFLPPPFDVTGYLASVAACREQFPGLRVLSGVEVGEPHWHAEAVAAVLARGSFDRVLGSLHCLPLGEGFAEPPGHYPYADADDVVARYFDELARLVDGSDVFAVLAHVDYPLRSWPADGPGFDLARHEERLRHALRLAADKDIALEVNTALPLDAAIVRWWHEEGGDAVSFGSDAHDPSVLARGFREAAAMAEACGFRPGDDPLDFWSRLD
jgi:histidinol-phosphatase (PHP family)